MRYVASLTLTMLALSGGLRAAVIHVPADQPTIQAGIDVAVDGDTVLVDYGIYRGAGNRDIVFGGKAIVVRSVYGFEATTIDCEGYESDPHRAFVFRNNEAPSSVLEGFTITGGYAPADDWGVERGGAVHIRSASPTIRHCRFTGNFAAYGGAAIMMVSQAHATITSCQFLLNESRYGGGIYCFGQCSPTIDSCLFRDNFAERDGGGLDCDTSSASISRSLFVGNSATAGGAMMLYAGSNSLITSCTFADNMDTRGVIFVHENAVPEITNSVIAFNPGGTALAGREEPIVINCCDIFANPDGDWEACAAGQEGLNGNLSANPQFCNVVAGDYSIAETSPLAPANNNCGVLIGALAPYCDYLCVDADDDGYGDPGLPEEYCFADNCPSTSNPYQEDADGDEVGDSCDACTDLDGDAAGDPGFPANTCVIDNCPNVYNPDQINSDADSLGDDCDNCPTVVNDSQADADRDGLGDLCDECTDTDGDGYGNPGFPLNTCAVDNCPAAFNPDQADSNGNGVGDVCECSNPGQGDICLHLNNGRDVAYIGATNRLEVWIANSCLLGGMSPSFELIFAVEFAWNMSYGNYPPVNEEGRAVGCWNLPHLQIAHDFDNANPEHFLLGGAAMPGAGLPAGPSEMCYSFEFTIPDGEPEAEEGIQIGIYVYPPAGTWCFTDPGGGYPPDFCGEPSVSETSPVGSVFYDVVTLQRGDVDFNGVVNISDATAVIAYIFFNVPKPVPFEVADVNCDEIVNITDAVYLMCYIFAGGPPPC